MRRSFLESVVDGPAPPCGSASVDAEGDEPTANAQARPRLDAERFDRIFL
jgi:hypothetical protein